MLIERIGAVSGYNSHKEIDFGSKLALPALLADFRENKIVEFKNIPFNASTEHMFGKTEVSLYQFLSTHAHPSFLGTLQFGQMYDKDEGKGFLVSLLQITTILSSRIIVDFRDSIKLADKAFDLIDEEQKNNIVTILQTAMKQ